MKSRARVWHGRCSRELRPSQEADGGAIGARVREMGREFEGHAVDFRDRDAVATFAAVVADRADILVNNAGTIRRRFGFCGSGRRGVDIAHDEVTAATGCDGGDVLPTRIRREPPVCC